MRASRRTEVPPEKIAQLNGQVQDPERRLVRKWDFAPGKVETARDIPGKNLAHEGESRVKGLASVQSAAGSTRDKSRRSRESLARTRTPKIHRRCQSAIPGKLELVQMHQGRHWAAPDEVLQLQE